MIKWSEDLRIGIKDIDDQHQWLFDCLARLQESATNGTADSAVQIAFDELRDYVNIHFFMEEGLMRSQRYPELAAHLLEHEQISRGLEELSHQTDRTEAFGNTVMLLSDWLVNHIGSSDRGFASYLKKSVKDPI